MENNLGCFERGRIASVTQAGYAVESLDRKGIVSPPLLPISDSTYDIGDRVLFVLFDDGTGKIICDFEI